MAGHKSKCPKCGAAVVVPNPVAQPSHGTRGFEIAAWAAGVGLLLLAISPFFKWINFGSGGVIGLNGDDKIVLGVTVVAMAAYITVMIKQKWLLSLFLGVQAWGTLAMIWMGSLIWKVGSILGSSEMKGNPFAAMFATQISPGAGLYLGLIGGIAVAGALGFIAVRRLLDSGSLIPYYATQGLSCVLGILLVIFVGPGRPSQDVNIQSKMGDLFPSSSGGSSPRPEGTTKVRGGRASYKKNAEDGPKNPRELYTAKWVGGFSKSRQLDSRFTFDDKPTTYQLTMWVAIKTEPDLPIKELYGHLAFVKDGSTVYETQVAAKPDVSFTDSTVLWVKIDPYDDTNQTHRTLRYAKDSELTPIFTVRKVVLADGKEKTFD